MNLKGTELGPPTLTWQECKTKAKEVGKFLVSLDASAIGTGLVAFDAQAFRLSPRSLLFNNHTYQWFANIGNEGACFEAVLRGLTQVAERVQQIAGKIADFSPLKKEDCPAETQELLFLLISIQIIADQSFKGLFQLRLNYEAANKRPKSQDLQQVGKVIFETLSQMEKSLGEKLVYCFPKLESDIKLEKYFSNVKVFLSRRDLYRESLRQTRWNISQGVTIPIQMIEDCLMDSVQIGNKRPNKAALRNAANTIHLPMMADQIPTQEATMWNPLRLITKDQQIFLEKGVTGTCERDGAGAQNLCNLYYRIDPDANQLMISSGAFNSRLKADQLVAGICEAQLLLGPKIKANVRWCVQGLYAFCTEEKIIRDIHHLIPYIEAILKKKMSQKEISFSYVNTCFNAASAILKSEDTKAFQKMNSESLAQLINYAYEDAFSLLEKISKEASVKNSAVLAKWVPMQGTLRLESAEALTLAQQIKKLRIIIENNAEGSKLERLDQLDEDLTVLQEKKELGSHSSSDLVKQEQEERLLSERKAIQEGLPTELKDQQALLLKKQKELEVKLKVLSPLIADLAKPSTTPETDCYLKNILLIFQVLDRLLSSQLKLGPSPISRCTEVELFLLLYRLLNINPIIICWSGLDRSGSVRALADTQSYHTRRLYLENLADMRKASQPITELLKQMVQVNAYEQMFQLIIQMDAYREEIFNLTRSIILEIPASQLNLIKDLHSWPQTKGQKATVNIREKLCDKIQQKYVTDPQKAHNLQQALFYLEYYSKQLLGTELEKTLNSTGVVGLKYHHDAAWLKKFFTSNPHPLQRMPPFIFSEEQQHAFQILEDVKGWIYNSTEMTAAGISLFLRLGLLRGK